MIPIIHDSKEKYLGLLNDSECCYVIEERNGMFELELTYNLFSLNWDKLVRGNIIIAHANDTLLNQKFRIYKIGKTIRGKFSVFAKHISYDMQRDMIEGLDIQNQSCEYCLNEIFRNSKFSQKFRGHSDIINAQDYKIGATKLLSAIGGTKGSILDTFGTGAELLRDNENIHVLNRRGHDNGVTIEYAKNLTGLDITEDEEGLITRIRAIAKYTPEGGEETTISTYVDSPNIDKYETPFTETIDFSNKFENEEIPTVTKLEQLALAYFRDNQCDVFKGNYKIQFIPLSKCAGYEDIEDKISLCDIVHIKDYRYNLDDKAKIIKATYDPLKERYVSMEVGVPRSSLSDVISNDSNTVSRDEVKDIINNSTAKFPNTLPSTPVLSYKLYGFSNIELSWTFENKIYYNYELYASKTKDFKPNAFDLIHAGQSSSFLFQAKPNETWYFRCCAVNTHGNRTGFSSQVAVTTKKIDDFENYFSTLAVSNLVTSIFSTDYMEAGIIKANWIELKGASVIDGNGKRTLDIDSFGNFNLDVTSLKVQSKQIEEHLSQGGVNLIPNPTANTELGNWESTANCKIIRYELKNNYVPLPNESNDEPFIESSDIYRNAELHLIEPYGGGLAMMLRDCSGKIIFFDGGYKQNAQHCIEYMKSLGVEKITYYIVTHSHSDHIEASPTILQEFGADYAMIKESNWSLLPSAEIDWGTQKLYEDFVNKCNDMGVTILNPQIDTYIKLSDYSNIKVFNSDSPNHSDYNHQSLMFLYTYKNNKVFLAGDGTHDASLSAIGQIGTVDIMQLGHHGDGSIGGSSQKLIDELKPKHAYFASDFLATGMPYNSDLTLKRVSWHYGLSYSHGTGFNGDFKFTLDGNAVTTTAKSTFAKDMWYEREPGMWFWFKTDGYLAQNEWLKIAEYHYYFGDDYVMYRNKWKQDGTGAWFYLKDNGKMAVNETININGKDYIFDNNGACTNPD